LRKENKQIPDSTLYSDERVQELFLVGSSWPVICIVGGYIFLVTGFGQRMMKDRKAFDLTTVINIYNIIQIVLNFLMGFGVSVIFI
jgi:hypothetical protein